MSNKQSVIKENNSQATDQHELLVLENNYKVSSVINFHIDHIVEELKDLTSHFFNLGYHLFKLKESWDENLTKSDFYKYCEEKFFLKSTSIKNFINVYKSFRSIDDEDELDERFEGFSFTALVELLPISDDKEFAKEFKQLSTREIKEVVAVGKEDSSDDNFLKQVFGLMKILLEKKKVSCEFLSIDVGTPLPEIYMVVSYGNAKVKMDFSLRTGTSYYGYQEEEIFYLRSHDYIAAFEFWSQTFGINDLSEVVNKIAKAIIKYSDLRQDEPEEKKKEMFVPTGAAKRLNLKKKQLVSYVDNSENYMEDIEIHVHNNDSFFPEFQIRCLRCCDYIWGIFRKPSPDDYGYDDLSEEEKNTFKLRKIINNRFVEINNYEKEELMLKE